MIRAPLPADRAVVITGIGAVTPLGNDFDSIADALLAGRSGVVEIDGAGFAGNGPSGGTLEAGLVVALHIVVAQDRGRVHARRRAVAGGDAATHTPRVPTSREICN
jgi:3-oxoacyl-(acyl-carrier-protein) synthase